MKWTESEIAFITERTDLTAREAGLVLGRTKSSVKSMRHTLGVVIDSDCVGWTKAEIAFLEANRSMKSEVIASLLSRSMSGVVAKRNSLQLGKAGVCEFCAVPTSVSNRRWCEKHSTSALTMKGYRYKCKVKGWSFNITEHEFLQLVDESCTYCGGQSTGIDRVDSDKDYIAGNMVPCCRRCNVMKNDMTLPDFETHIRRIAAHIGSK